METLMMTLFLIIFSIAAVREVIFQINRFKNKNKYKYKKNKNNDNMDFVLRNLEESQRFTNECLANQEQFTKESLANQEASDSVIRENQFVNDSLASVTPFEHGGHDMNQGNSFNNFN